MSDELDSFIDKKAAESPYIQLLDGDSVQIKLLKSIKPITKVGFAGEEVECLRYTCIVETEFGDKIKNFDNASAKFAKEVREKGAIVGSSFTLTREGEKTKTVYTISDVVVPQPPTPEQEAVVAGI